MKFEATKRHFENLVKRYGNPIIILNLIKVNFIRESESNLCCLFIFSSLTFSAHLSPVFVVNVDAKQTREKRPRETILRAAFANAIEFINKDLSEENHLRFLHWDLNKHSRRSACCFRNCCTCYFFFFLYVGPMGC